jgi:DNA ligase-1
MARNARPARTAWSWSWYIAGLMSAGAAHGAHGDTAAQGSKSAPTLPVLLAQLAPQGVAPAPYLVSEKLDGVRALWDGQHLRFRSGRLVPAPTWFLAQLPAGVPLDGELWLGRGRFDALSAIVRKAVPIDDDWRQLRYMVFDMPSAEGTFASRAERLQALLQRAPNPQLVWVEQKRLNHTQALQHWLDDVVTQGGEGLMLHRADALVIAGRSDVLLKLKPQQDAEATVMGYRPGKGKYLGQTGALQLRTANGIDFALGTGLSDALRRNPPSLGSTVSYRFRDVTPNGKPRFASFLRIREDF